MNENQLYWRSRRGSLELDLLLRHYLEHQYSADSVEKKEAFCQLLSLEDCDLLPAFLAFING